MNEWNRELRHLALEAYSLAFLLYLEAVLTAISRV